MALHHLSEGRTSINQITLSPTDGRSFSFQRCIDENISTKLFLHLVSLHLILVVTFRQKWPVWPMMPRGCLFWASLTMSLPLSLSLSLSLYLSLSLSLSWSLYFYFVFVFFFVIFIVLEMVMSCPIITLIFRQQERCDPCPPGQGLIISYFGTSITISSSLSLSLSCKSWSCWSIQSSDKRNGVTHARPGVANILLWGISYYLSPCQGQQYVSHPLSDCYFAGESNCHAENNAWICGAVFSW